MRFETERIARARLDAVLHHAPIGIVVADAHGHIELVNSSAARLVDGIDRVGSFEAVYALGDWAAEDGSPIPRESWSLTSGPENRARLLFTAPGGKQRVLSGLPAGHS